MIDNYLKKLDDFILAADELVLSRIIYVMVKKRM